LRTKDELKEFYTLSIALVDSLKGENKDKG
jgi:hypothetical protein